jgi:hypothetical protein
MPVILYRPKRVCTNVISYEENEHPRLAAAPAGWRYREAEQWVRAKRERLTLRDADGSYMLPCIGPEGGPVIGPPGSLEIS